MELSRLKSTAVATYCQTPRKRSNSLQDLAALPYISQLTLPTPPKSSSTRNAVSLPEQKEFAHHLQLGPSTSPAPSSGYPERRIHHHSRTESSRLMPRRPRLALERRGSCSVAWTRTSLCIRQRSGWFPASEDPCTSTMQERRSVNGKCSGQDVGVGIKSMHIPSSHSRPTPSTPAPSTAPAPREGCS